MIRGSMQLEEQASFGNQEQFGEFKIDSQEFDTNPKTAYKNGIQYNSSERPFRESEQKRETPDYQTASMKGFYGRKLTLAKVDGIRAIMRGGDPELFQSMQNKNQSRLYPNLEEKSNSQGIKNSTSVLPSMRNRDMGVKVAESDKKTANLSAVSLSLNKNSKFLQKSSTKLDTSISLTIRSQQLGTENDQTRRTIHNLQANQVKESLPDSRYKERQTLAVKSSELKTEHDLARRTKTKGLNSPRQFWPSDEIFMQRAMPKQKCSNPESSQQQISTKIWGKFKPVLEKKNLEKILFDENYKRYMNCTQIFAKDQKPREEQQKQTMAAKQTKTHLIKDAKKSDSDYVASLESHPDTTRK